MNRHAQANIERMNEQIIELQNTIDHIVDTADPDANPALAAMRIMDIECEIDELEKCIAVLERLA